MENNQPIIIKRVKRFAAGHHGGAWKIAFADFATAMMAFFLVLWLMSTATPEQKIAIAGYFKDPIGFSESGTPFVIDLGGSPQLAPERTINPEVKTESPQENIPIERDTVESMAEQVEKERLELLLQELQTKVEENPQLLKFKDQISFEITPEGLRIQITDAANRPMFDSGSARLRRPQVRAELGVLGQAGRARARLPPPLLRPQAACGLARRLRRRRPHQHHRRGLRSGHGTGEGSLRGGGAGSSRKIERRPRATSSAATSTRGGGG